MFQSERFEGQLELRTTALICPGFHASELTDSFVRGVTIAPDRCLVFPIEYYPPYLSQNILNFLNNSVLTTTPLVFFAFSAGVVGAIAAAREWQARSGRVRALIALDGWGVPLWGNFPIHRLSHDRFTHWSSRCLGGGEESFYADPGVEHLALWRSPGTACGWREWGMGLRSRCSAAEFIDELWQRYSNG
ncbi:MAG: hypothetical protein SVX43_00785 [Cyanobacteriota bacterium]|nr:hypothetical protein [Cyanobacteriota bacterium]